MVQNVTAEAMQDELFDIEIVDNKIFIAGYANSIDSDIPATPKKL